MDYFCWNDNIAAKFFNPEMAGRRVYLHVTKELIAAIGQDKGVSVPDFVKTVRRGPPWCSAVSLCLRAKEAFSGWRKRKLPVELAFPPYIGFLGLFVLAAGLGDQGEFAIQAYYPRLRKLLGELENSRPYPHFEEMRELWADLETWSQEDKQGELGIFEYPATGRYVNVGIPISQTILTEEERTNLSSIFADGALDASLPPAQPYLTSILQDFGTDKLRPRTLRILQNPAAHREEYEALIDTVLEELASWDGTVPELATTEDKGPSVHASLRLCLDEIDEVADRVAIHIRCRTVHEFPEDGLSIALRHARYRCQEYGGGWSSVLEEEDSGLPADVGSLDIFSKIAMREVERGWRFTLPASLVRVFVSGASEGMPGYVEVQQLPSSSFFVLADESASEVIHKWGESSCLGFRQLKIFEGLPEGSNIYSIERAISDDLVRDVYPVLSFPTTDRIRLDGGIRISGNTFLDFAAPRVVVESNAAVEVLCNERQLQRSESGYFELPTGVPDATRLIIEIRKGRSTVARKSILIRAICQWQALPVLEWFDGFGASTSQTSSPRIAGAIVVFDFDVAFDGWIESAPPVVVPEDSAQDSLPQPAIGKSVSPQELSHSDVIQLVQEWRDEISAERVQTDYTASLALRSGGREMTDGAVLYRFAYLKNDARAFNRAVGTLTKLVATTQDPIVLILARAYLQLAFYRSNRFSKVSTMEIPPLPAAFSRLEVEMRALAWMCGAEPAALCWKDGLGFSDLSLLDADCVLENEIRERIENLPPAQQAAPVVSEHPAQVK